MKTIKKILYIIFPFLSLFKKVEYIDFTPDPITLSGEKLKLIREYPLRSAKLTLGKVYDVVDVYKGEKRISAYATIPLTFKSIVNDDGEVVLITPLFFEEVKPK